MYYIFPTIYIEATEYPLGDDMFIRLGTSTKKMAYMAEAWLFQPVEKVFPGIYKARGKSFYDLAGCYRKFDGIWFTK